MVSMRVLSELESYVEQLTSGSQVAQKAQKVEAVEDNEEVD